MTASTRHETLIKAITDLGADGGGKTWKIEASRQLDNIWDSAVAAINSLSAKRAKRLTAAVIAVMIDRSEKQATRVLQGPPVNGTFHADHTRPNGYDRVNLPTPALEGKLVKRARWVYERDLVKRWWKKRKGSQDRAKGDRQQQAKIARLLKQRADLVNVLQRTAAKLGRIDQELAQMRINLFTANGTLEAATIEPQPWILDAEGLVHDQAWLPVATTEEITQLLDAGGDIHWMPLTQALREYVWADGETREAWANVWRAAASREHTRIDSGLAVIREKQAHALGKGLQSKEKVRART